VPPELDGDSLTFSHATDGNFGTVTISPTGAFTYTRNSGGIIKEDTFTYDVSDGSTTANGSIHLAPDNQPPANPVDDHVELVHNYRGPKTIAVLANDPYPEPDGSTPVGPYGEPLKLVIVGQPAYGEVRINADNTITYTPHQRTLNPDGSVSTTPMPDPNGLVVEDTFRYLLQDTVYGTESGSATVHIVPDNQAPPAPPNMDMLLDHAAIGHAIRINPFTGGSVTAPATDADGDPLHLSGVGGATGGLVQVIAPDEILYTPSATTIDDTFTYSVADQYTSGGPGTIHLHWSNDPPHLVPGDLENWYLATGDEAATEAGDPITGDGRVISYWFSAADASYGHVVSVDRAHGVLHDFVDPDGDPIHAHLLSSAGLTGGASGTLTVDAGSDQVTLIWGPARGASSYDIYRGTASGQETRIASGISARRYTDSDVRPGTTYYYTISPVSGGALDTGRVNYSFKLYEAESFQLLYPVTVKVPPGGKLPQEGGFVLGGFDPQPVYAVGPMTVSHGNISVDKSSLVTDLSLVSLPYLGVGSVRPSPGDGVFLPANLYFRGGVNSPDAPPEDYMPSGEVSFYRQLWDGIVPSPPTKVVIDVIAATKVATINASTGAPVSLSIDPSGPGSMVSAGVADDPNPADFFGAPIGLPPGTSQKDFPEGFFAFAVVGLPPGGHVAVTMVLPPGESITSYWKYENVLVTHYDSVPSYTTVETEWSKFTWVPATDTGAETHATNPSIPPNEVVLHLVADARGLAIDPGGAFVTPALPARPRPRFVTTLYEEILDRFPEPRELAYWVGRLKAGWSRHRVARAIFDSREHRRLVRQHLDSHIPLRRAFLDAVRAERSAPHSIAIPRVPG
jgi:hypothetical protein